jgi:hypothetical protein
MKTRKIPCSRCHSTRYLKINAEGICGGCETALKLRDKSDAKAAQIPVETKS